MPKEAGVWAEQTPILVPNPPACTFPTSSTYNALKCLNERSWHLLRGPPGSLLGLKVLGKEGRNAPEPGFSAEPSPSRWERREEIQGKRKQAQTAPWSRAKEVSALFLARSPSLPLAGIYDALCLAVTPSLPAALSPGAEQQVCGEHQR